MAGIVAFDADTVHAAADFAAPGIVIAIVTVTGATVIVTIPTTTATTAAATVGTVHALVFTSAFRAG